MVLDQKLLTDLVVVLGSLGGSVPAAYLAAVGQDQD